MFLNNVLSYFQKKLFKLYSESLFLKNIDLLIGICILGVVLSSVFSQSDNIGNFALLSIFFTVIKSITKPDFKFSMVLSDKFLLIYFLFVIISLAGSSLFYLSLKGFCKTIVYLGFYVTVVQYLKDNYKNIKYLFGAFIICLSIEIVFAFLQHFACISEISGWQDMSHLNPEEIMTRVYGTLKPYNPNLFGGYILAIFPCFLFLLKKQKLMGCILGVLTILTIIFTGCRGAYIALFTQIILIAYFIYKNLETNFRKIFIYVGSVLSLAIMSIISLNPALHARILSIFAMRNDSSNSFRFNVYNSCINMFKDNWVLGIGVGNQNFREIYGLYMKTGFDALSAYNIYLEIAVESGIFALISFVLFVIFLIKKAIKKINNIYTLIALISIVGILVHGFVDTVFFRPQIQFVFWIMVAILRGEYGTKKNRRIEE